MILIESGSTGTQWNHTLCHGNAQREQKTDDRNILCEMKKKREARSPAVQSSGIFVADELRRRSLRGVMIEKVVSQSRHFSCKKKK